MNQENKFKMSYRISPASRLIRFDQKRRWNAKPVHHIFKPTYGNAARNIFGKYIADTLTLLRIFLGIILVGSALFYGSANPGKDIWLLVIAWSTDMLDGRISRILKTANQTWLGKNDVYIDMFLSVMVLLYLGITGMLPVMLLLIYLFIWSVIFIRWGIPPLFAQVFQNPIYAYFVFIAVRSTPSILPWLLLWSLIALIFFWRRLMELFRSALNAVRG